MAPGASDGGAEFVVTGLNGPVPTDRRIARFSWTSAYEDTFFRSLIDSMNTGLKDSHSFKSLAWDHAIQAIHNAHGAAPSKSHLINKLDNMRKKFRLWRSLRVLPEFYYDEHSHTLQATDETWATHIAVSPAIESIAPYATSFG